MIGYLLSALSLCYIVYIYALLVNRDEKVYTNKSYPVSVIIPCYNEEPKALKECIKSLHYAGGEKQIILVDNNSTNPETLKAINQIRAYYKEVLVLHESRQGKRFAHSKGLQHAIYDIIVFVDSDTSVNVFALMNLTKPFQDKDIGAVAGQVKVMNRNDSLLTKSLSAMFWTSNNLFRKATSGIGYMGVIAGALGAYRKDLLLKLEKDYLNQKFLGRPCAISDDRFITMRIQTRFNKKIEYQANAIGYTYMPTSYRKAWKMIERWKRGVLRETFVIWKEKISNARLMFFDIQFNFIITLATTILKLFMIYNLIFHFNLINLAYTLFWFILVSTLYSSLMIVENIKELPYKLIWSLMYEFFFVFTFVQALLNIRNQGSWNTR